MNTPQIAIDARVVGPIPHGFSRYIWRLAEGLLLAQERGGLPYEILFLVSSELREVENHPFRAFKTVEVGAPFLSVLELLEIPVILKKLGISLYHSPTFSSLYRSPCPWIVTIHDLNHLAYGDWKKKFYYEHLLKPFALEAEALVTVSEFSRREISSWTGISAESIPIVLNSLDSYFEVPLTEGEVDSTLDLYGLERGNYWICLSNPKPHKNVSLLVKAYEAFCQSRASQAIPLVLSMKEYSDIPGVIPVGGIPDHHVRVLMSASRAVIFPSLYEGFGLPPVEAASLGAPVIVSEIEPHREGLRNLMPGEVRWVDPRDLNGWVSALQESAQGLISPASHESRQQLLKRFDVRRMAQDMDRIYRRVLGLKE